MRDRRSLPPAEAIEALERRVLFAVTALPIGNPSFESVATNDDNFTTVAVWLVPGVTSAINAYNPTDRSYVNAADDSPTKGALPSPGDQKQVLFLNGPNIASQSLDVKLAADIVYTLTVAVGNRGDLIMENYRISLFAGETLIATATGDGEAAPDSGFVDVAISSTAVSATSPLVGQQLRIELANVATKGGKSVQVNFDNVRLTAETQDEPILEPPTAAVTGTNATPGSSTLGVTVTYQASAGAPLDASSVTTSNVRLSGPNNYSQLPSSLSDLTQTTGGAIVTVTYNFPAPGGELDVSDNGTYELSSERAGVFDANGISVTAGPIGSLPLIIAPPVGELPEEPERSIGGLDPTFGDNGMIRPRLGFTSTVGVRQQPDEKLVIAGNRGAVGLRQIGLARTTTAPEPDTSFGVADGVVFHTIRGPDDYLVDFELLPDGKILAAGVSIEFVGGSVVGSDLFVARFNADGTFDTSFGTQGRTIIDFASDPAADPSTDVMRDLLVQADGRIVVAGRTDAGAGDTQFAVARLEANGTIDATFGSGGRATTDFAGGDDGAQAVAAGPDGSIIAAGFGTDGGARHVALAKYLDDGTLDGKFGNDGLVLFSAGGQDERANAVAVAANGVITVAGPTINGSLAGNDFDSDALVAKLSSRGTLDRRFGDGGIAIIDFGQPTSPTYVANQADGRVLISGVTASTAALTNGDGFDIALARLMPDGSADASFGDGGTVILPTSASTASTAALAATAVPLALSEDEELDAFQNSVEGKLADRVGGGALLAGTNGDETVIAALITSGVELSGELAAKLPTAVIGGAKGSAAIRVVNVGDVPAAGEMEIKLFVSADQVLGVDDHEFQSLPGQKLKLKPLTNRGKPKTFKVKFNFPTDVVDGSYFLLAQVNADGTIAELNPNNNAAFSEGTVEISAPFIDLTGQPLPGGTPLSAIKPTTLRLTLENGGNVLFKGTVDLAVVFSTDAIFDAGDQTLSNITAKLTLKPDGSKTLGLKVPTEGLAAGDYYLFVQIDPENAITESDTGNNLLESAVPSPLS